uniref:Calponin-homology (CH) domain-containing protein n=1 Tax=Nothoprocta perdicaria TaxID=30464 RepID=A0A8C6ZEX9_NOTPE
MGNTLSCIRAPREPAGGNAPLDARSRGRLRRVWRRSRRTAPEPAPHEQQPLGGGKSAEDVPAGVSGTTEAAGFEEEDAPLGRLVRVKEHLQEEIRKVVLVWEPPAEAAGGSLEEGLTVVARLLDNPAEKHRGAPLRWAARSRRAVLLPLPKSAPGSPGAARETQVGQRRLLLGWLSCLELPRLLSSIMARSVAQGQAWEQLESRGGAWDHGERWDAPGGSLPSPKSPPGSAAPSQISDIYISGELGDMSAKEKLLLWTQKVAAGYIEVKCTNFSSCWSDGKMFNAIIHRYRPDLVDMDRVQIQSNRENLEQAFEIAERLGVTRLLDAEDVDVPSPDEKSVITYVSSIYDAFPKVPEGGEGISVIEVDSKWVEYQSHVESLMSWIRQHTILMSDKSFSKNPVELKALYNEYIHFKETEIPLKEQEKGKIEEVYKLLEVWIEFGRIKLPQGYHPNDVEEEWGKLIIEMLEREKLLRPEVERLELLLHIANKIHNGALNCEEKLTFAKNLLQADTAHLQSGQPVQKESDVVMYLQECEVLIRQLQVDVQILRDENYYQLEELVIRITRLQEELQALRLECTNLYRKGNFPALGHMPISMQSIIHVKREALSKGLHTSSGSWFRKPMTRTELVAISSSEDEGSLRFVYELLAWVEEMQVRLDRAEWGNDLPSVESHMETQRHVHSSVEELASSVKEAQMYEGKISRNFRTSYAETLGKLKTQYCKLLETSSFRLKHLQSLHGFVSQATAELIWLNEREEEELAYDWSDKNPNIAAKKIYFSEMTMELEEKRGVFWSLQDTAEMLSLQNHPAKQTVEAYSAAVQTQWQWIKQLCLCVEQHVKENTAYFQFFSDARESEAYLRSLQDSIKRKYTCDHNMSLSQLEDLLQDSMDEKEQLIQAKSSVASLTGQSKTIVQLKPRNPDHVLKSTIPIKAVCNYSQIEVRRLARSVSEGDWCLAPTPCEHEECHLLELPAEGPHPGARLHRGEGTT